MFVFWRSGASARPGVSFVFCFGGSAPSVLLLPVGGCGGFMSFDAGRCCWCFLFWCPVASARPGVSFFWWLCLVFVVWCSGLPGASAALGCLRSFSLL